MGLNKTTKKKTKIQQRIPKKELDQLHELKIENRELKRDIKALHRFIKRIKSNSNPPKEETPKKLRVKIPPCPECSGILKEIKITRPDGSFSISSCQACDFRSPMAKTK